MVISLKPELLAEIGSFQVTNTFLVTIAVSLMLIIGSWVLRSRLKTVPGMFQNIAESILEFLLSTVDSIMQDEKLTRRTFPLVATIFLFVLAANWIELVPGLGTIGIWGSHEGHAALIPFIRSNSADLNMTLALSLIAVFSIQFFGIATIGAAKYASKFFVSPMHKPYGIGTFVGLLELVGEVSKIISFSFRLFGNIFAGEVLLIVMLMLTRYLVPVPFLIMELFVGVIQALVFAMLTAVFIKIATVEPHH